MPAGALAVRFVLEGDLSRLRIPPPRRPRLVEGLWRHTCFEVFLSGKNARAYQEFNLAPSGQWCAYSFRGYRKGRELARATPRVRMQRSAARLAVSAVLHHEKKPLRIGLAAVIEERDGRLSYWALRHPPGKPDFHRRRSFTLEA